MFRKSDSSRALLVIAAVVLSASLPQKNTVHSQKNTAHTQARSRVGTQPSPASTVECYSKISVHDIIYRVKGWREKSTRTVLF